MKTKSINNIIALGIDTSCDETSVSVLKGNVILSNLTPSQTEIHTKFGGVVPNLAKLAHKERIDSVILEALRRAFSKKEFRNTNLNLKNNLDSLIKLVDVIAVTIGPGLALALEIGVDKAKELSIKYNKPLVLVNHMEGHLLSSFTKNYSNKTLASSTLISFIESLKDKKILGFLLSGGHTELIKVNSIGSYEKLGESLDDAIGECYDKCGRILGLGYPAGALITKFAKENRKEIVIKIEKDNKRTLATATNTISKASYTLPISMVHSNDLNFSFSGLKTAFNELVTKLSSLNNSNSLNKQQILDLCVLFEFVAIKQLEIKLESAIKQYNPTELWLGGGVTASAKLRSNLRILCNKHNIKFNFPTNKKLTGDNASMIALACNIRLADIANSRIRTNDLNTIFEKLKSDSTLAKNVGIVFDKLEEVDRMPNFEINEQLFT